MFNSYKKLFVLSLGLFALAVGSICHAGIISSGPMLTAEYWNQQNPNAKAVILDKVGIKSLNDLIIRKSPTVVNLAAYPQTVSGAAVKLKLGDYSILDDDLYLHGKKVSDNYKNILRTQTNVGALPASINVQYGVVVRRCPVRNLPTGEGLYYYADDKEFDVLQDTMLDPCEPVAILHKSQNGFFYYVQARNYSGWVYKSNVGLTDRSTWLKFLNPDKFLVVTDKDLTLKVGAEQVLYQQGTVLPIVKETKDYYTVSAPEYGKNGSLNKQSINILKNNPKVNKGYLPYTSQNILNSAFKFLNAPYGWGGLKDSVDCSSLVFNVYRTVGIYLPRNADDQETTAENIVNLLGMSADQRKVQLGASNPGAALAMPNHIMLYLGQVNDEPYAIHSLGSHFANGSRQSVMKVVVSDLKLMKSDGNTYLNHLTHACEYR